MPTDADADVVARAFKALHHYEEQGLLKSLAIAQGLELAERAVRERDKARADRDGHPWMAECDVLRAKGEALAVALATLLDDPCLHGCVHQAEPDGHAALAAWRAP